MTSFHDAIPSVTHLNAKLLICESRQSANPKLTKTGTVRGSSLCPRSRGLDFLFVVYLSSVKIIPEAPGCMGEKAGLQMVLE